MVSRENQVFVAFSGLAVVLFYAVATFTNLPTWVSIAVVLVVGLLIPQLINGMSGE